MSTRKKEFKAELKAVLNKHKAFLWANASKLHVELMPMHDESQEFKDGEYFDLTKLESFCD